MGAHAFRDSDGTVTGVVHLPNIYEYGGFTFEWHSWLGPMKLRKDFEPAARQGLKFYQVIDRWRKLTKKQQAKTQVYG